MLFVSPVGDRLGGGEEQLWTLLRALDRGRVEPSVAFLASGPFVSDVRNAGIDSVVIPAGRMRHVARMTGTVRALAAHIRRRRPDVIVTWGAKAQLYGGLAGAVSRVRRPVVWMQLEMYGGWLHRIATAIPSAGVMCASHAVARSQAKGWPRRSTFVVHPGIEIPSPAPDGCEVEPGVEIPRGSHVVGMVGRLQAWKRHAVVLQAISLLRATGHDVHGLFVGGDAYGLEPSYPAELERLARNLGISPFVTFTGQVPTPAPYVRATDVAVNASDPEPFGLSILEAMAAGVPVVAVASGGPAEIIRSEEDGLLVERSTPEAIADAVGRLLTSAELRERLAAAGARRVRESFTARRMADEVATNFEKLARSPSSIGK